MTGVHGPGVPLVFWYSRRQVPDTGPEVEAVGSGLRYLRTLNQSHRAHMPMPLSSEVTHMPAVMGFVRLTSVAAYHIHLDPLCRSLRKMLCECPASLVVSPEGCLQVDAFPGFIDRSKHGGREFIPIPVQLERIVTHLYFIELGQ